MLCRLCRDIFSGDTRPVDNSSVFHSGHHHVSQASLEASLSSGCWICRTLAAEFKERWTTKCSIEYIFIASHEPQVADEDEGDLHLTFFLVNGYEPKSMLYLRGSSILAGLRFSMSPRSSYDEIVPSSHIATFDADSTEFLKGFGESTGSESSLLLARKWLDECCKSHDVCSHTGMHGPSNNSETAPDRRPWYPTRLLDVGISSSSHIRLAHSHDTLLEGPYVALSHCWGGKVPLRLLESNMTALQTSIDLNELPRTFADAVKVARKLEVKYLWIDSLCIIQDSTDDWNHEALQMCDVYRRCLLCIVAGTAANSTEGLFKERKTSACVTSQIIEANWKGRSLEQYFLVDLGFWRKNVVRSPINGRAWVLQERLLSPRVLRFEKEQVFWECLFSSKCESFPNGVPSKKYLHTPADSVPRRLLREGMRDSEDEEIDFNHMWYRIVSEYSQASLTRPEDKLIAISGLAKAMQRLVDDSYVAGMWRRDLLPCISWKAVKQRQDQILPPKPPAYRAPSWSWAAIDGEASLQHLYDAERFAEIHSCNVVNLSDDPFGQIIDGSLCMSGALVAVVVHHDFGYPACRVVDWESAAKEASKKLSEQSPLKVNTLKRWTSLKHLATCWTGNSNNMALNLDEPADAKEFMAFLLPIEKTEWLIRGLVLLPAAREVAERGVYVRKGMFEANLDSSKFLESKPKMTPAQQLLYQDHEASIIMIK